MKTAMAGKAISNVFSSLRKLDKETSFSTPSPKKVLTKKLALKIKKLESARG